MTLAQLEADLYRRLGYDATPATAVTTRLRSFLNDAYKQVLSTPGLEQLRLHTITETSTASTQRLFIPPVVSRIISIHDTTNNVILDLIPPQFVAELNPDEDTGIPYAYALGGRSAEFNSAITGSSALYADSDSASDTNDLTIEGIRHLGSSDKRVFDSKTVTMTGTTAVQIGTLSNWVAVTKAYLSSVAIGTVVVSEDSEGGTTICSLYPGEGFASFQVINLIPTPAGAYSYTIHAVLDLVDLANATEEPVFPREFHQILVAGARAREYERREMRAQQADSKAEFDNWLSKLRYWIATTGSLVHNARIPAQRSQLGSQFPPWS